MTNEEFRAELAVLAAKQKKERDTIKKVLVVVLVAVAVGGFMEMMRSLA